MCHTSFNALGATTASASFAGGLIPAEHWYAPALNASKQLGLGSWTNADIVKLLKTGVSRHGAVYGPMAVVVEDSLQHLSDSDLNAIAIYLRAQPILRSPTDKLKGDVSPKLAATLFDEGHQLYTKHCLACHQANGEVLVTPSPPWPAIRRSRHNRAPMPFAWSCLARRNRKLKETRTRHPCRRLLRHSTIVKSRPS
jgi:mono/diheme cytochrome c family protein